MSETYETSLVKQLRELEYKSASLRAHDLGEIETQSVLFPIPSVLIEDQDHPTMKFFEEIGHIERSLELGLHVEVTQGASVLLTDGRTSTILEVTFFYQDGKTDIDGIESYFETIRNKSN